MMLVRHAQANTPHDAAKWKKKQIKILIKVNIKITTKKHLNKLASFDIDKIRKINKQKT